MAIPKVILYGGAILVLLIVFGMLGGGSAFAAVSFYEIKKRYGTYASTYSSMYGIPYDVILAVIAQESAGDANAQGSSSERGLMQLTEGALVDVNARFHVGLTWDSMYKAGPNIQAGTAYLRICKDAMNGNLQLAIQAYNAGMSRVKANPSASLSYFQSVEKKRVQFNQL